jgi:hypothetical protein
MFSDNPLACQSGFNALVIDQEEDNSNLICLPSPKIVSHQIAPDYKCTSVKDKCIYESILENGDIF